MRKTPLFQYKTPKGAAKTLAALREAFPTHTFKLEPSKYGHCYNIRCTKPDGSTGLVRRTSLAKIGSKVPK